MILHRLLLLCMLPMLWCCDGLPGKPDPANRYIRPTEVTDFDTLYSMNCSGCHGAEGKLGPAVPLADPMYLALASPIHIEEITRTGVTGTTMPAFAIEAGGTLTDQQIAIIARGLSTRWGQPQPAEVVNSAPPLAVPQGGPPGNPERGAAHFKTFCGSCHGPEGRGTARAGSVVEPPYLGLVSDQNLRTNTIIGRRDLGMPDWRQVGDRPMRPEEVTDIVAWLASQRIPRPSSSMAN